MSRSGRRPSQASDHKQHKRRHNINRREGSCHRSGPVQDRQYDVDSRHIRHHCLYDRPDGKKTQEAKSDLPSRQSGACLYERDEDQG